MLAQSTRTTLVVDDEQSIRETLERLLRSEGYEVKGASNGREAIQRLAEQPFEIVLLDIKMPVLSGMDVLRELRANYADTYVIMITAVADVETAVNAMKAGAYDYVMKPFNLDDILLRMKNALRARQLELQTREFQKYLADRLAQQEKELRALTVQTVQALIREELPSHGPVGRGSKRSAASAKEDIRAFGAKILQRISG